MSCVLIALVVEPNLILSGIHLIRVHTLTQLVAFFSTLDAYLMNHPAVRVHLYIPLAHHFKLTLVSRSSWSASIHYQISSAHPRFRRTGNLAVGSSRSSGGLSSGAQPSTNALWAASIALRILRTLLNLHFVQFLVTVQFSSKVLDLTPQDPTGPPYYRSSNNNSPSGNHNAANGGSGSIRGPLVLAPQLGH